MCKALFVLGCLICSSHGRREQNFQGESLRAQDSTSDSSLQSLATFLYAMDPTLNARTTSARQAVSHVRSPVMRPQGLTQGVKLPRTRYPEMRSAYDVASDCLDEGCPLPAVEGLLKQLKAEKGTSPEVVFIMKQLESLVELGEPNKNEMESLVGNLLGTFSATDGAPLGFSGEPTKAKTKYLSVPKSTVDLAEDCLEKGCPVDLTSELLGKLKAEENPGEEAVKAIKQLEDLLAAEEPNKNELETMVQDLLRAFSGKSVSDDSTALGYSGDEAYMYSGFFRAPRKSTIDLASNCLDEGCPVGMVTDLLTQLKAEKNPSPEAQKTIKALEELLATPQPNKNEVEKLVTQVVQGFKASYVTPNEVMDGLLGGKK